MGRQGLTVYPLREMLLGEGESLDDSSRKESQLMSYITKVNYT